MLGGELAREAMFYRHEAQKDIVNCYLCPHNCRLKKGQRGKCGVREHSAGEEGTLMTLNYGELASHALDPIEKKPLYHFYPGNDIFSIGTVGCNFACGFCQNWSIAHNFERVETIASTPEDIVKIMKNRIPEDQRLGIAYTYNEPSIWFEFVYDTSKLLHREGMKNILVTNGFINREPLEKILPYIDAMNIDVKGFNENFYQKNCGGKLAPVKETVELASSSCHVEVTNLVIPTLNDSLEETGHLVDWLAGINPEIPLHFSRYMPGYKMELYPTPVETLEKALHRAREKMAYVYIGNVRDNAFSHTYCPRCDRLLLRRAAFMTKNEGINEDHNCRDCGKEIYVTGKIKG